MTNAMTVVKLPAALDPGASQPLLDQLRAMRGKPLEVNAADVERAGTHCMQVLVSAAAAWNADGQIFRVVHASPQFTEAASLLGLTLQQLPMELATQ